MKTWFILFIIINSSLKPQERGVFWLKGHLWKKNRDSNRHSVENRISWAQTSHVKHSFLLLLFSIFTSFCCSGFHRLLKVTQIDLAWWQGVIPPSRKATAVTKIQIPEKKPQTLPPWLLRSNENTPCWVQYELLCSDWHIHTSSMCCSFLLMQFPV